MTTIRDRRQAWAIRYLVVVVTVNLAYNLRHVLPW